MKKITFFVVLGFYLFSCSYNNKVIRDIKNTPQNALLFVKKEKRILSYDFQNLLNRYFDKFFFSPWNRKKSIHSKKTAFWGFNIYPYRKVYGENKKRLSKKWFKQIKDNSDIGKFPSLSKWGITVKNSYIRVFPTIKPIFYSFDRAGEGFPFDYNQNSVVYAGTPVFISHVSKDKEWFFVETGFVSGWIKSSDVAFIDKEIKQIYMTGKYVAFIKDGVPVVDQENVFRFKGFIGGILPSFEESKEGFYVYIPVKDTDGYCVLHTGYIPKKYAVVKPWKLTQKNIAIVINNTLNKPYGWGGLYFNRDCSANIRDIFVPFGIWLPRNSTSQAKSGIFVPIDHLSIKEKEKFIKEAGIPFLTLVWMRGHIMLYIGNKDGKPYVFHNFWGIKTNILGKEGRLIVGMSAITSLQPEKGVFFVDREKGIFLKRIKGITYIIPPKYLLR